MKRVFFGLFFAVCALLAATPASANWWITKLTNQSDKTVAISIPFAPGESRPSQTYLVRGNLAVTIPGKGAVVFIDKGHNTQCGPYWGLDVTYGATKWAIYYDGDGAVEMTVKTNGDVDLIPAPGRPTQVIAGGGPPRC